MIESERRGAHRVTLSPCGEADEGVTLSGMVQDLSASGAAFVTEEPFDVGRELRVAFSLTNLTHEAEYRVEGRVAVVRADPREEGGYRVAVRFLELEGEGAAHLREYLEDLLVLI